MVSKYLENEETELRDIFRETMSAHRLAWRWPA